MKALGFHAMSFKTSAFALAVCVLVGCASPPPPATPEPHAFISYTPPEPGDKRLRVGIKDLINMKGQVTSAGSEALYKHREVALADAECLKEIRRRRDIVIVGKTNLSEFAIGVSGSNVYFGTPINAINPDHVPGGSSSGSAVAVARGLCDVALGTDTAGSIRVPAACNGIVGLKTTFGLISTEGVYPISPTYLDTVGPMARDIQGTVTCMGLLKPGFEKEYAAARRKNPEPRQIRIGRLYMPGTDPAIDAAIDKRLAERGFQVVKMDDAFRKEWLVAQENGALVAAAAAWFNNNKLRNAHGVARSSKLSIFYGDMVYSLRYGSEEKRQAALEKRDEFQALLEAKFRDVDAIVLPVLKRAPYKKRNYLPALYESNFLHIQYTMAVNYSGVPALAVPLPLPENPEFPVTSMQIVGPKYSEAELLNIGRMVEGQL